MKFEHTEVFNFKGALRGARNPKESWHLSDSWFGLANTELYNHNNNYDMGDKFFEVFYHQYLKDNYPDFYNYILNERDPTGPFPDEMEDYYRNFVEKHTIKKYGSSLAEIAYIGPKDLDLAQRLICAGSEHRKFMRQIIVCVDITAPMFWFSEFDTYKVGTVANSTSKMHKLTSTPITIDCFETGDFNRIESNCITPEYIIDYCEGLRQKYNETKDKEYWKELIRWLPESWLQTRTITMSYENLFAMCGKGQRRFHKLIEWSEDFINWARTLPYAQELIFLDELKEKENESQIS